EGSGQVARGEGAEAGDRRGERAEVGEEDLVEDDCRGGAEGREAEESEAPAREPGGAAARGWVRVGGGAGLAGVLLRGGGGEARPGWPLGRGRRRGTVGVGGRGLEK